MPSRLSGYQDTSGAAAAAYSWPPGSSSSPPGTQPTSYYGYAIAPSASYDSHSQYPSSASSQPPPPTQRSPEANQGTNENPTNGNNPEQPPVQQQQQQQDRAGPSSSPPSRANSYEQQQQQEGKTTTSHGHNTMESTATTNQSSPSQYTGGSPAYSQAVPRTFVASQGYPIGAVHAQYAWAYGTTNPYSTSPHARRSLAPEYSLNRPDSTKNGKSLLQQAASSNRTKPRATSPTQIETSRRDEVANMGCTCKKSKCLKLYCMCFGASVVCGTNCRCLVCFNTPDHEADRKEAVRVILSRNPAAFDTKFKKNAEKTTETNNERVLSHKIGCKCRKSQCTKKYCECFNAGIKCSATCRCTGCQNMPPGGFGPDPRYPYPMQHQHQPYPAAAAMAIPVRHSYVVEEHTSVAAQSLAFLKHSSPNKPAQRQPIGPGDPRGIASMPSIVSSDATPTPDTESSPQAAKPAPENSNSDGANVLLMAAYAMAELNSEESPKKTAANGEDSALRPSPKRKSAALAHSVEGEDMNGDDAGSTPFESPPKPFPDSLSQQEGGKDAPSATATSKSPLVTPAPQRKSKRSRVGTHKKSPAKDTARGINGTLRQKNSSMDDDDSDDEPENKSPASTKSTSSVEEEEKEAASTPMTRSRSKKSSTKDVLTPVSARAIDFRRMNVRGKKKAAESDDGSDESQGEQMEEETAASS